MSHDQVSLARDQLYQLFKEVRKEVVPLVDAFDFPDKVLNSALGRYDGDVYNHLYQWAQRAPRNKKKVRLEKKIPGYNNGLWQENCVLMIQWNLSKMDHHKKWQLF